MKGAACESVPKLKDAVKFPIAAFNVFIQETIEKCRRRNHLVIINNYVFVYYNGEHLFIYLKDENNNDVRINIEL